MGVVMVGMAAISSGCPSCLHHPVCYVVVNTGLKLIHTYEAIYVSKYLLCGAFMTIVKSFGLEVSGQLLKFLLYVNPNTPFF